MTKSSKSSNTKKQQQQQQHEKPLKIQFAHGLESGPNGQKVQMLKKKRNGFSHEVLAPDMQPLIQSARKQVFWRSLRVIAIVVLMAYQFGWRFPIRNPMEIDLEEDWPQLAAAVLVAIAAILGSMVYTARKLVTYCVALQLQALKQFKPDVLIGSSFGGAIVAHLVSLEFYQGPVILLAPAHGLVDKYTRLGLKDFSSFSSPVLVVHGMDDKVVPLSNSEKLKKASQHVELLVVEDDHPLRKTFKEHHREWIQAAIQLYNNSNKKRQ